MSNPLFETLHQELRTSYDVKKWLVYSTLVRDTLPVLEHIFGFAGDKDKPKVLL
jgi:hypothetical protein